MNELLAIGVGVVSAIIAVFLLQTWPHGYRWSSEISWTEGDPSGRSIYQVKIGRTRRRLLRPLRRGPMDARFYARVAVTGIGFRPHVEKVVPIPLDKEWRPVVAQAIAITLLPEICNERDLRYFPETIRKTRRDGSLNLADLLAVGDACLRVYAFAYRRRAGTRWMLRGIYTHGSIRPGDFRHGRLSIEETSDGRPPRRPDPERPELSDAPALTATTSRWRFSVARRR